MDYLSTSSSDEDYVFDPEVRQLLNKKTLTLKLRDVRRKRTRADSPRPGSSRRRLEPGPESPGTPAPGTSNQPEAPDSPQPGPSGLQRPVGSPIDNDSDSSNGIPNFRSKNQKRRSISYKNKYRMQMADILREDGEDDETDSSSSSESPPPYSHPPPSPLKIMRKVFFSRIIHFL
jgi:hypothetical protein